MHDPPEESKRYQRRTVLVKRSLQLKYVAIIFLSVVVATLFIGGDIYYTMCRILLSENPSLAPMVGQVRSMILVKMVLYFGVILFVSLILSHRFAGPIYRFEKSCQAISSGDLTHRVTLRTGDELLELQEEFNAMVSSLQSMAQKDRELARHLASRLEAALKDVPEERRDLRDRLRSLLAEIEHIGSDFKA